MPYDSTDPTKWLPEDDTVQTRLTGLLSQESPLMKQAETMGKQFANKRGLANSSMAAQATQDSLIKAALPIASQEAQQAYGKNTQASQIGSQENIARMNVAAHDREKSMSAAAAFENIYGEMFRTLANNENLPATTRDAYLQHLSRYRDSMLNLVEQFYGIDLNWATPELPAA